MIKITQTTQLQILFIFLLFCSTTIIAQIGIGTTLPTSTLDVEVNAADDGIDINNIAGNGDPRLRWQVNGTSIISMGIDDSDADKFKIGTTALTTNTRLTIQTNGNIGIRTTTPAHYFHVTNGGTDIGATALGEFENLGADGVALSGYNNNTTTGYNGIEGITNSINTGFLSAGVFGIALNSSASANAPTIGVRGGSNEWQGTGVYGSRFNSGGANTGWGGQFYNDLGYTGFFGAISDERTKKDISKINGALSIISNLNPVKYKFDLEKYPKLGLNDKLEYGFIAQEIREVLPEITRIKGFDVNAAQKIELNKPIKNERELFIAVDYTRLIPILTKGLQEQQQIIESQNDKIKLLEKKLADLEAKVNSLLEN